MREARRRLRRQRRRLPGLFADSYPGADETCDGNDNDCDGDVDEDPIDPETWYRDQDEDDYGTVDDSVEACAPPEGYVARPGDCADDDKTRNPGAAEACTGKDDDCDGDVDEDVPDAPEAWPDLDGDEHGDPDKASIRACTPPEGWAATNDDCDDGEPTVHGGADEICDGLDNDCDPPDRRRGARQHRRREAKTVADAVTAAASGGSVQICAGTWPVNLSVDKSLTLVGPAGPTVTFLEPASTGSPIVSVSAGSFA